MRILTSSRTLSSTLGKSMRRRSSARMVSCAQAPHAFDRSGRDRLQRWHVGHLGMRPFRRRHLRIPQRLSGVARCADRTRSAAGVGQGEGDAVVGRALKRKPVVSGCCSPSRNRREVDAKKRRAVNHSKRCSITPEVNGRRASDVAHRPDQHVHGTAEWCAHFLYNVMRTRRALRPMQ